MKKINDKQKDLFNLEDYLSTAPCVPQIRKEVRAWKNNKYKGATKTTKELLKYWFYSDHILSNGKKFKYYYSQQEAMETIIYINEICKIKSRKGLLQRFIKSNQDVVLPIHDNFGKSGIKMATGSGKTKVMALVIAWHYLNAVKENDKEYAKDFLIVAPNVIVYDRLCTDFRNGIIFKTDPIIPKHLSIFWDLNFYTKDDFTRPEAIGNCFLTNIQQLYSKEKKEIDALEDLLGEEPDFELLEKSPVKKILTNSSNKLIVINDEAHHTWDEENAWNRTIRSLNESNKIIYQFDFSATPRFSKGKLFSWVIFDYPLKQAILDRIVKNPIKGFAKIPEGKSKVASTRYSGFLTAGVERWKEYRNNLKLLKKKPILFIMMHNTSEADDVGDWLRKKYSRDFAGNKTLVIHTDKSGEISTKDLEKSRKLARDVDNNTSNVNAIVSVLMLREGWDVQNVTVVVGLRPYTATTNILPEQTIGRGLRLMFRNESQYDERVDIIGNNAFLKFVDDLEKLEDLKLETFEVGKDNLKIETILPEESKKKYDTPIPELTSTHARKRNLSEEIEKINVNEINIDTLPYEGKEIESVKKFMYEGFDIITKVKEIEREYTIPEAQTPEEVISYYAKVIASNIRLPSHFSPIATKIKEFFENKAFGKKIDLNERKSINAMSSNIASYVTVREFEKKIKKLIHEEKNPEILNLEKSFLSIPPFPFSQKILKAKKTIFNYCACDNDYEYDFAQFLDNAEDVKSFNKIPLQFDFSINYLDGESNSRYYHPDFVVRNNDNEYFLVETKGRQDIDVKFKDQAAKNWCLNTTKFSGKSWKYIKVLQKEFIKFAPEKFKDLSFLKD